MRQHPYPKTNNLIKLTVLLVVIFLSFKIVSGIVKANKSLGEFNPSVYSLPFEDSSLISKNSIKRLKVIEVYTSEFRNPVSFTFFDNSYNLVLYKIDSSNTLSMGDLIHLENKSVSSSVGLTYRVMANKVPFKFLYKSGAVKAVSQIYLTISGDSLRTVIQNDSVLSYHFLCDNFSIRYSKEDPIDVFVESKKNGDSKSLLSMDLLLLKKSNAVYLLFMTPANLSGSIYQDLLLRLIKGSWDSN